MAGLNVLRAQLTVATARNDRVQMVDDIFARLTRLQTAAQQSPERFVEETIEDKVHCTAGML